MFFTIKLYLHLNCLLMLSWIVWNGTLKLCLLETELFNIELFWHLTVCKQNLYIYLTELAKLELFE